MTTRIAEYIVKRLQEQNVDTLFGGRFHTGGGQIALIAAATLSHAVMIGGEHWGACYAVGNRASTPAFTFG